jgi:hypothetical protein
MASSAVIVVGGLVGLAAAGGAAAAGSAVRRRPRRYLPSAHAEYADRRGDPFGAALRRGFGSAQVPLRLGPDGGLYVGRGDPDPARGLHRVVLEPLMRRYAAGGGRVRPGQTGPFELFVEFVADDGSRAPLAAADPDAGALLAAYRRLDRELRDHAAMLTRCVEGEVVPGAVRVVVAGALCPRHLLAAESDRYAFADGTFDDLGSWAAPTTLVPLVSEHWGWRFGWDGLGTIPPEERHLLRGLVRAAHAEDRRVRLFGLPRRPRRARRAFWRELAAAGVDLLSGPDLGPLARHMRGRRAPLSSVGNDLYVSQRPEVMT